MKILRHLIFCYLLFNVALFGYQMVVFAGQEQTSKVIMLGFLALMAFGLAIVVARISFYEEATVKFPKLVSLQVLTKFTFLLGILIPLEYFISSKQAFEFQNYTVVAWIFQACLIVNLWYAANKKWTN